MDRILIDSILISVLAQCCLLYTSLESLVVDGIIGGVGTVLGFVPQIVLIFFFLALLEDSGYMARVAFIMRIVPLSLKQLFHYNIKERMKKDPADIGACSCVAGLPFQGKVKGLSSRRGFFDARKRP